MKGTAGLAAFVAHLTSFEKLLNYFSRTLDNMKNSSVYLQHLLTTSRALSHKPRPKGKQETEKKWQRKLKSYAKSSPVCSI